MEENTQQVSTNEQTSVPSTPDITQPNSAPVSNQTPDVSVGSQTAASSTPVAPAAPVTPVTPALDPEVVMQQALTLRSQAQLETLAANLRTQGVDPRVAQFIIQNAAAQQAVENRALQLENHPVVRRMAAEKAVQQYAAYGVKPEQVIDAPTPQAMEYAAWKIAQENHQRAQNQKAADLQARAKNGNDTFESTPSSGPVTDYNKTSGLNIVKNALRLGLKG